MNRILSGLLLALVALTVMSCEKEDTITGPPATENPTFASGNVKHGAVYYSFDAEQSIPVWDIVFKSNGPSPDFYLNTTRLGGKQVARIYSTGETDFDAVTSFNAASIGDDADTTVSGGNWYDYNMTTHQLTTKGLVYILYGASDQVYKFRIDSYASNVYTLRYARFNTETSAFEATQTASVDKTAGQVLFSFATGTVSEEKDWDIKLTIIPTAVPPGGTYAFPGIILNSNKNVAAKVIDNKTFADVNAAAETGLATDTPENAVIGTNWFDYNQSNHLITSKNHTYVLQTAGEKRTKFRVINYYNADNQSGHFTLEYTKAQ